VADTYACCKHCEHDDIPDDFHRDTHALPCPEGCNDPPPRTSEFSSLQRKGGSDNA